MNYHSRRIPTPGASRKRKEREPFNSLRTPASARPQLAAKPASKNPESVSPNWVLAGYMAHEFLTKGTLFGQKFDPDGVETVPVSGGASGEPRKGKPEAETGSKKKEHKSYADVASILKMEGSHIPGIVNPSQLASWIRR